MSASKRRNWYVVHRLGFSEPDYLVNALSERSVRKWLGGTSKHCKVMIAKSWSLAKVMSGSPVGLPQPLGKCLNEWTMNCEGHYIEVAILN